MHDYHERWSVRSIEICWLKCSWHWFLVTFKSVPLVSNLQFTPSNKRCQMWPFYYGLTFFSVNLATNNTFFFFFYFMFKTMSFFFLILCSKQCCFWLVNTKILMDVDRRDTLTLLWYSGCKSRDQFRSNPKLTRIPESFILLLTLSCWLSSSVAGLLYELYMSFLIKNEKL